MNPLLLSLAKPLLLSAATSALTALGAYVIALLQKATRTANLAAVAQAAEDALQAALKAAGDSRPSLASVAAAAKASVLADLPDIEKSLEAELDVLIHGQLQTATVGNITVNLPNVVPLK